MSENKEITNLQADMDTLTKKYGKLEVATRSLHKRVEELEAEPRKEFTDSDLHYLKELVNNRKSAFDKEVVNTVITPEFVKSGKIDVLKAEKKLLDELVTKISLQLIK
ncbi:hypothetical protein [Priestia megaterium]|uniref:hypothetical protein n=1 Tax=Priestia megaterium TaxID=1404 RepID=UPI000BF9E806|nr:hypothetical protein [Priestia megaterium]PFW43777.1 hypothetical protein COL17_26580 [Priestia megaterium]